MTIYQKEDRILAVKGDKVAFNLHTMFKISVTVKERDRSVYGLEKIGENERFLAWTNVAPVDGKANDSVMTLLAEHFQSRQILD